MFTLSPEASSGPLPVRCILVAQGCCGLLLWQDIREGLVFSDTKHYPISHPRKSFRPGNITSGLLLHHTPSCLGTVTQGPQRVKTQHAVQTALSFRLLIST